MQKSIFPHETTEPWIFVRSQIGPSLAPEIRFTAQILGLRTLKCAEVQGFGATEEEAVRDLRQKVLQYLDLDAFRRSRCAVDS